MRHSGRRIVFWSALLLLACQGGGAFAGFIVPGFRGGPGTTYFGWDVFERVPPPTGPLGSYLLDDGSPDLGSDPGGANIRQNNALWGNVTGTNNLYSGFFDDAVFDVSIAAPTAGVVGSAGWTTLVLQVVENGGTPLWPFTLNEQPPVERSSFDGGGRMQHWYEWHVPGNAAFYPIEIRSPGPHATIDAIVVDTVFTAAALPVDVTVPEPATWLTAAVGVLLTAWIGRGHRRRAMRAGKESPMA